jgi:prepilin-type N-terminal cleavage/methylation domain-containing protein
MTQRSTAGFTLIEVVVGLAVSGIVILTGFTALAAVQARAAHAVEATAAALEGANARATLVDWLSAAALQSSDVGASFQGLDAEEHGLAADEILFPTRASTPRRSRVTGVRLYLDSDPTTAERGLVAELVGMLGEVPQRVELAPAAIGIEIRYLPDTGFQVEWAESWFGPNQLPRAVEITLYDNPFEPLPALLRLPIRVPLATLQ